MLYFSIINCMYVLIIPIRVVQNPLSSKIHILLQDPKIFAFTIPIKLSVSTKKKFSEHILFVLHQTLVALNLTCTPALGQLA